MRKGSNPPPPKAIKSVFIITKQGIYTHGVHAVSLDDKKAIELCNDSASRDIDDYHEWLVFKVTVDELFIKKDYHDGWTDEDSDPIYRTRKSMSDLFR